jgi:SAM-dependent methyltransferase
MVVQARAKEMPSLREIYLQWRNKILPASKHNIMTIDTSIKYELYKLESALKSELSKLESVAKSELSKLEAFLKHESINLKNISDINRENLIAVPTNTTRALEQMAENESDNIYKKFATLPLSHVVPEPEFVSHAKWVPYLSAMFNKPGTRILEIGARNVTGAAIKKAFSDACYTGFDFYEGENVDVVGDAHKLSSYFDEHERFDLILSSAVFEHLHMPWVVAQEIQKLLKVGGYLFVETHFSFAFHEGPWNFFQFSNVGLRALFNSALGFDLIDSGMSNPMNGVFSQKSVDVLRGKPIGDLYCHSEILCKKAHDVSDFEWSQVGIDDVVDNTRYPLPK